MIARSSAYERLRRMQPVPEPFDDPPADDLPVPAARSREAEAVPSDGLESLERRLLGAAAPELSLKERLMRLAQVAGRRERTQAPVARHLEELVQGKRVANDAGEFFLMETDVPLESFHGQLSLSRLRLLEPESVGLLTGEPRLADFDLSDAVFLDTETTGLAGGTGTAAFLIGLGFVEGERFRVRQYFMRDYHEEPALLVALAEELRRFRRVVTFNGKLFDLPLLETRYRMCRSRFPLSAAPHFDLLHPARRLWKARLESCRLQSLEQALLGLRRVGDVSGDVIPGLYFDFVRRRDARALVRVFEHNRLDIVSLFALSVLACHWVQEDLAEHGLDCLSLGRLLERGQQGERAARAYRRSLESDDPRARVPALLRLAAQARRASRWDEALELWHAAAASGEWRGCRELAIYHEHRTLRLDEALSWATRAVDGLLARGAAAPGVREELRRRQRRLERKLRRRGAQPMADSRNSTSS